MRWRLLVECISRERFGLSINRPTLPIHYTALLHNIHPQTTEQLKQPVCPSEPQLYDLLLSEAFSTPAVFVSVNNPYHLIGRRDRLSPAVIRLTAGSAVCGKENASRSKQGSPFHRVPLIRTSVFRMLPNFKL